MALSAAMTAHENTLKQFLSQPRAAITMRAIYATDKSQHAAYPLLLAWSQLKCLTLLRYGLALCDTRNLQVEQLSRLQVACNHANFEFYKMVFCTENDIIDQDILSDLDQQDLDDGDLYVLLQLHRVWPEELLQECFAKYAQNATLKNLVDTLLTCAKSDMLPLNRHLDIPIATLAPVLIERSSRTFSITTNIEALVRTTSFFCNETITEKVAQCYEFLMQGSAYQNLRSNDAIKLLLDLVVSTTTPPPAPEPLTMDSLTCT